MVKQLKRIGIFGGSFDPPHIGHLVIAELARRTLRLDFVYFVPAYKPPHKAGRHASTARDRLVMTTLSTKGSPGLRVSDAEIKRRGVSYTVDTVRAFRRRFPKAELFLIIGGDSMEQFHSWKQPDEIAGIAELAVYRRGNAGISGARQRRWKIHRIKGPRMEIASSEIRQLLADGKSVDEMVRKNVLKYIKRRKLYLRSIVK